MRVLKFVENQTRSLSTNEVSVMPRTYRRSGGYHCAPAGASLEPGLDIL
jgi:hypothetical protein